MLTYPSDMTSADFETAISILEGELPAYIESLTTAYPAQESVPSTETVEEETTIIVTDDQTSTETSTEEEEKKTEKVPKENETVAKTETEENKHQEQEAVTTEAPLGAQVWYLDIKAYTGYAYITYQAFITDSEIAAACAAAYEKYPQYLDGVNVIPVEDGRLMLTYPSDMTSADFEAAISILEAELPAYINSLTTASSVKESEPTSETVEKEQKEVTVPEEQKEVTVTDDQTSTSETSNEEHVPSPAEEEKKTEDVQEASERVTETEETAIEEPLEAQVWYLDIEAYTGYAYITYPAFVTDSEIAAACAVAYEKYPQYLDGVNVIPVEDGRLMLTYHSDMTSADFETAISILEAELPAYIASLTTTSPVEESEPTSETVKEEVATVIVTEEKAPTETSTSITIIEENKPSTETIEKEETVVVVTEKQTSQETSTSITIVEENELSTETIEKVETVEIVTDDQESPETSTSIIIVEESEPSAESVEKEETVVIVTEEKTATATSDSNTTIEESVPPTETIEEEETAVIVTDDQTSTSNTPNGEHAPEEVSSHDEEEEHSDNTEVNNSSREDDSSSVVLTGKENDKKTSVDYLECGRETVSVWGTGYGMAERVLDGKSFNIKRLTRSYIYAFNVEYDYRLSKLFTIGVKAGYEGVIFHVGGYTNQLPLILTAGMVPYEKEHSKLSFDIGIGLDIVETVKKQSFALIGDVSLSYNYKLGKFFSLGLGAGVRCGYTFSDKEFRLEIMPILFGVAFTF